MTEIERAIKKYKGYLTDNLDATNSERKRWMLVIEALQEKKERDNVEQWLDDMGNPLEPLKIQAALQSEVLKLNLRKERNPLDYTIIAVLIEALKHRKEQHD